MNERKINNIIQHGDVLLIPYNGKKQDSWVLEKNLILEYGSATGNSHKIKETKNAELYMIDLQKKILVVYSPCHLIHEEHKTIKIDVGLYEIQNVKERDPYSDEIRKIAD